MNITDKPNLMPLRDYSEHDVLPFFAPTGVLNKGTFVTLVNTASGNTNVAQSGNSPATPYQKTTTAFGSAPAYAYGVKGEVQWTYKAAGPSDPVLGVMIYDCKENNAFGEPFRFRPPHERAEQQVTIPGESSPVLKRGTIMTNGFTGAPLPGSGATVSGGQLVVAAWSKSTSVGMFLTAPDANGYAMFAVSCV